MSSVPCCPRPESNAYAKAQKTLWFLYTDFSCWSFSQAQLPSFWMPQICVRFQNSTLTFYSTNASSPPNEFSNSSFEKKTWWIRCQKTMRLKPELFEKQIYLHCVALRSVKIFLRSSATVTKRPGNPRDCRKQLPKTPNQTHNKRQKMPKEDS
jgi:hypothetical protein